jgi:hypothetical protein
VQTAFARNLPFFHTKQVDVASDVRTPPYRTRDVLAGEAAGTIGASIMDYSYNVEYSQTWSGGLQYGLSPATMVEVSYMGTWTIGADNATVHNVPEPGPGAIQPRRPIPELSRINAIRFDGKSIYHGLTLKTERRLRDGYALKLANGPSQASIIATSSLQAVPISGRTSRALAWLRRSSAGGAQTRSSRLRAARPLR